MRIPSDEAYCAVPPLEPGTPLVFVMFHIFRGAPDEWAGMIRMAAQSVQNVYPQAEIVLLSNLAGGDADLPEHVRVVPVACDPDSLMLRRLQEYRAFVASQEAGGYVVLMDTDMLLLRSVDELFVDDFDIGLTVRKFPPPPINGGFYVVNMRHKARVLRFFDGLLSVYESLPAEARRWNGDQIALARLLDPPTRNIRAALHSRWQDVRIKYLPVRIYNNTPRRILLKRTLYNPAAKVLHLKGRRKGSMPSYFKRYVDSRLGRLIRKLSR